MHSSLFTTVSCSNGSLWRYGEIQGKALLGNFTNLCCINRMYTSTCNDIFQILNLIRVKIKSGLESIVWGNGWTKWKKSVGKVVVSSGKNELFARGHPWPYYSFQKLHNDNFHCNRDWWNSGAKQEFSQHQTSIFLALSWKSWENRVCTSKKQGFT